MVVRFSKVNDHLLRGGKPTTSKELSILKNVWNVDRIVSLDSKAGNYIHGMCGDLGIEHIIAPIDHSNLIEQTEIEDIADNIEELFDNDHVTYVHCVHGRDRTGLVVALYRVKHDNWDAQKALDEALSFQFGEGIHKKEMSAWVEFLFAEAEDVNEAFDNFGEGFNTTESRHSFSAITPPIDDISMVDDMNDMMAQVGINQKSNSMFSNPLAHSGPIEPMGIMPSFNNLMPSSDSNSVDDRKKKRRKRLEDMNDMMANVGLNSNSNPILRGVGPIEPCGILPFGNFYF